ncbi:hypothetical protein P4S72_28160 [Vibrio sp. PP-XX7]
MNKAIIIVGIFAWSSWAYADDLEYQPDVAVGLGADQGVSAIFELNNNKRVTVGKDGLAFDYLFQQGAVNNQTLPGLDWYVGLGGWSEWNNDNDFGVRFPLGLEWNYQSQIKVYGQIHPELVLHDDVDLQLRAAVGVLYKF